MNSRDLAARFEELFQRSLARQPLDATEQELSNLFEFIAGRLLGALPSRQGQYFDGVVHLVAAVRKARQVAFRGDMWVGDNRRNQWTEPFQATVTDKRITEQGLWITISVGGDRAEGEIVTVFGLAESAERAAPSEWRPG